MAVTITQSRAAVAIRAATSTDEIPEPTDAALSVLFPAAVAIIEQYAADAPSAVQNAACVRLLGWLWDADPADAQLGRGLQASGAASLLQLWREHRAGAIGADAPPDGGPVTPQPGPPAPTSTARVEALLFDAQRNLSTGDAIALRAVAITTLIGSGDESFLSNLDADGSFTLAEGFYIVKLSGPANIDRANTQLQFELRRADGTVHDESTAPVYRRTGAAAIGATALVVSTLPVELTPFLNVISGQLDLRDGVALEFASWAGGALPAQEEIPPVPAQTRVLAAEGGIVRWLDIRTLFPPTPPETD